MAEMSQAAVSEAFTQAKNDELAVYEAGFHVVPTVAEAEAAAVAARLRAYLEKAGAAILTEEAPKKIKFAYRIERAVTGKREKFTEGYFGSLKFEAPRSVAKPFEEILRADKEILRFLLILTQKELPVVAPHAVFASDRLEGETIQRPAAPVEPHGEVSEEDLDKSIEALVG